MDSEQGGSGVPEGDHGRRECQQEPGMVTAVLQPLSNPRFTRYEVGDLVGEAASPWRTVSP